MLDVDEMKKRIGLLNMSPKDLARRAGIAPSTLYRVLSGHTQDPRSSTLAKARAALEAREAELRRGLLGQSAA